MLRLVLHGGRADIWRDGQATWGPHTSYRAWPLLCYALHLWFYERWPGSFNYPRLEVKEPTNSVSPSGGE